LKYRRSSALPERGCPFVVLITMMFRKMVSICNEYGL